MTATRGSLEHIHADGRTVRAGETAPRARLAMILVHGRGATPESILTLVSELPGRHGFAFVAPGASESTAHPLSWYPQSFLAPLDANEPGLSSGLAKIDETVSWLREHEILPENIILLGFSQGACLVSEYAARNARRWGAVVALTGGLIGDADAPRDYPGGFDGTPVFLGCSDRDQHVPLCRVDETEALMSRMGAKVEKRIYAGMPHTIIRDELDWVAATMGRLDLHASDDSRKDEPLSATG